MKYYNLYPSSHRTSIRYPSLSHVCPIRTCQPLNSPSFYDRSMIEPSAVPSEYRTLCQHTALQFYRIASAVPSEYRTLCQHTALQFYRIASAVPSEYRTLYHPIMRVSSNTSPSAMGVESIPVRTVSPPFVMHHHSSLDTSAVSPSTVVMYNP